MARILHNRSMRILPIILSGLMLLAVACSKDEKIIEKEVVVEKKKDTYIFGDPAQFVYGTVLTNHIPDATIFTKNTFYRVARSFSHTQKIVSHTDVMKREMPTEEDINPDDIKFYNEDQKVQYGPYKTMGGVKYFKLWAPGAASSRLIFEELSSGGLRVVGIDYEDTFYPMNKDYIHTSVKENVVSIWIYDSANNDNNSYAYAYYFVGPTPKPKKLESGNYNYNLGKNILSGWDQAKPLIVNICGGELNELSGVIEAQVAKWQAVLVGRLTIRLVKMPSGCPPYIDVNTHNIYLIDGIMTDSAGSAAFGQNRFLMRDKIIDSDILMYRNSIYNSVDFDHAKFEQHFAATFVHEFGHFLGLDHQMNKEIPSVMSYDRSKRDKLQPYDINAIQALYPLVNP